MGNKRSQVDQLSKASFGVKEFDDIILCYLPREENQMADALATLASMIRVNKQEEVKPIQMSIYEAPAHCYNINE